MNKPQQQLDAYLFSDLESRGLIKQVTDPGIAQLMAKEPVTVYCGFDPTSDSLHVGSLLPLLTLRRFQQAGHKVVALVGGATGMIGDPSFKAQERTLLQPEQLKINQAGIAAVMAHFLDMTGPNAAVIANNADWFQNFTYIDFLRDVGKHFTVNYMMAKESVRARLEDREHGISYTEFSYMILQAYDFYYLNKKYNCRVQLGGSDQWGNITAGTDLIRKMKTENSEVSAENAPHEAYGITFPLVTKADGTKFGKSEKGNVWLDAKKTSPYRLYQFFIQTSDADAMRFVRYFTFLSQPEISVIEESMNKEPEKRAAQLAVAREVTRLVHGAEELERVERASQALFGTEIKNLDRSMLEEVFADTPSTRKKRTDLQAGIPLADVLAESGLCNSKGAARKDLAAGGIYLNNERAQDPAAVVRVEDLIAEEFVVLRKGKRNYHVLRFES